MLGVSEQTARARVSRGLRALSLRLREPDPVPRGRRVSALDELRENLREAARRDVEANRVRTRRRHRRATGFVVARPARRRAPRRARPT